MDLMRGKISEEAAAALHAIVYADCEAHGLSESQAVAYCWTISARASQAARGTYEKREH